MNEHLNPVDQPVELSDEDLKHVAGGNDTPPPPPQPQAEVTPGPLPTH
ncbi:hypothetical protein RQP53_03645 [Paucibacter sp. APW11]|uniref:Bacteriocin n=1 Tax=Roseateles aquae TaxID=3077235 RepID=A0ABU3P710_9BURK|nr:hypothetical protein [Paucibacter sp. APW11]MDT8998367.1 hypothetical protein [Paucibacter sp. APW11]